MWSLGVVVYILLCGYPPFWGSCGSPDCRWEAGETCHQCQASLFQSILEGRLEFPASEWATVSAEAIDLIRQLLVKEAAIRLTAAQVLGHPWLRQATEDRELPTPAVIRRSVNHLFHNALFKTANF